MKLPSTIAGWLEIHVNSYKWASVLSLVQTPDIIVWNTFFTTTPFYDLKKKKSGHNYLRTSEFTRHFHDISNTCAFPIGRRNQNLWQAHSIPDVLRDILSYRVTLAIHINNNISNRYLIAVYLCWSVDEPLNTVGCSAAQCSVVHSTQLSRIWQRIFPFSNNLKNVKDSDDKQTSWETLLVDITGT